MNIEYLWIDEYKNMKDFEVDFKKDIKSVFIVGPNGVGKTNVFEVIIIIFQYIQDKFEKKSKKVSIPFDFRFKYRYQNSLYSVNNNYVKINHQQLDYKDLYHSIIPRNIVAYNAGDSKRIYELAYNRRKDYKMHFNFIILEYNLQKQLVLDYFINNRLDGFELFVNQVVFYFQPSKIEAYLQKEIKDANYYVTSFLSYIYESNEIEPGKTLEISLNRDQLHTAFEDESKIFEVLQVISKTDIFSSFTKSRRDYFKMYLGEKRIEFSELGEGIQLLYSLQAAIENYSNDETLFLLDEPDAFIHPTRIDMICNLLLKQDSQILITTHSPALISRLKDSSVVLLKEQNQIVFDSYYGKKSNYIYQDLMSFKDHPVEIENIIIEINKRIENRDYIGANEELEKLKSRIGNEDTDVIALEARINISEFLTND